MRIKLNDPKQLKWLDKIGYFNYIDQLETGSFLFYETCGLAWVKLHWQSVNWLLRTTEVERVAAYISVTDQDNKAFFAIQMICDPQTGEYELNQTGTRKYIAIEDAIKEAKAWAEADQLPYKGIEF